MITLITPTGARPEAFFLCEHWMSRQTVQWGQWIVVDDGPEESGCTLGQEIIRPTPLWEPGQNTQHRNLLLGLEAARGDVIFFIEDDDWYDADYIETVMDNFVDAETIGECPAWYYNVPHRVYRDCCNSAHASLCQTAIKSSAIPALIKSIETGDRWIDLHFWRHASDDALLFHGESPLCIGIKGLPGRAGIGSGHKLESLNGWRADTDGSILQLLVGGEDAELIEKVGRYGKYA